MSGYYRRYLVHLLHIAGGAGVAADQGKRKTPSNDGAAIIVSLLLKAE